MSTKNENPLPETAQSGVKGRLIGGMLLPMLFMTLALLLTGWAAILTPATDGIARADEEKIAGALAERLNTTMRNAAGLLASTGAWLDAGEMALDHQSLNRRFMPLLTAFPEFTSLRIAYAGGEWMLFRKSDGSWLNRLSSASDTDGHRRFLHWSSDGSLQKEEQLETDYTPTTRDWFTAAKQAGPGQVSWGPIHRLDSGGEPGMIGAMYLRAGDTDLVIALDVSLDDVTRFMHEHPPTGESRFIVITTDGRLVGGGTDPSAGPLAAEETLSSVLSLPTGLLRNGIEWWLERGAEQSRNHLLFDQGRLWYTGFRRIPSDEPGLWLGRFIPYGELAPKLYSWLVFIGLTLLLSVTAVAFIARRSARAVDNAAAELCARIDRIGELDFTPAAAVDTEIEVFSRLDRTLERTRDQLDQANRHWREMHADATPPADGAAQP